MIVKWVWKVWKGERILGRYRGMGCLVENERGGGKG